MLVVGVLGGAVLAFMNRCAWFQLCKPLGEYLNLGGDSSSSSSSSSSGEKDKKTFADADTSSVQGKSADDIKKIIALTQQGSSFGGPTDFNPVQASPSNPGGHSTCAVRNGKLVSVDPTGKILGPCGSSIAAKYARANLAALTVNGGRMSYN